ncbi:hypothetical protein SD70_13915 [Gordoniibacillus kamchatkensis]|uniref:Tryptophan synthase beta chain-like PALP domain-containing protein n=1 Tax=Gordoniibacillus kamchatkensis TaxID=1590651 RepID=A0ABR5AH31_9BACL|nr:pyridoxal-phosphate dependent enzyme [Paenibacillus sp. VKM B-2647]KIL40339.1 hypothetical protein SD70_13915 [Paenibacillus sp. VKM B-2647]
MLTVCTECGKEHRDSGIYECPACGCIVLPRYESLQGPLADPGASGIWKYSRLLPPVAAEHRIYLGEGSTPLIPSVRLGKRLGIGALYFKYEGGNPTGSYKDRIAAMCLSWALARGRKACIGTSSGNAGAATAAYAARAGIPYHLFVLEHMAEAKLAQVLVHRAAVRKIRGFGTEPEIGDEVFSRVFKAAAKHGWEVTVTAYRYNPYAMEGVKTMSFEIFEQLGGEAPTRVFAPAGGGGLYCGLWKGFAELHAFGLSSAVPDMIAVQPDAAPTSYALTRPVRPIRRPVRQPPSYPACRCRIRLTAGSRCGSWPAAKAALLPYRMRIFGKRSGSLPRRKAFFASRPGLQRWPD